MAKKKLSVEQAVALQGYFIGLIGGGYHPDNSLAEYVNAHTGARSFTDEDIARLQPLHDEMVEVLDERVYTVGLTLIQRLG